VLLAVAEVTKALLDLAAPQPGERVLDIGCGGGTTVLELAARVGPDGHVLGADIAEQSVARARERIAAARRGLSCGFIVNARRYDVELFAMQLRREQDSNSRSPREERSRFASHTARN
jgi:precorrin-6B methylase 2